MYWALLNYISQFAVSIVILKYDKHDCMIQKYYPLGLTVFRVAMNN